ncbi:SET domain-containing protein 9-like isoform X1 [Dreissena polymorpha]|uniref:SET domain-containing protein 9-like isoform X1 n=1 Tax=Dreissena polymorpha TaxID=45954 RepID=UPI0022654F32|nr:SET domain-containing protein 9-like isoform X1 [Dreissena polymorpha]
MFKYVLKRWKLYKYRFVPWIAANITENSPRLVPNVLEDKIIPDISVEQTLLSLFTKFEYTSDLSLVDQHRKNSNILLNEVGFSIGRQASTLKDGGRGVFVTQGLVPEQTLVAIYPGLVYQPWEPVFWVSLANPFLFRCADGVHIDGKDTGLSKFMYKSCSGRDSVCGQLMCDTSWLTELPVNPLAVGQYVNNQSPECPANVAYQEFDVPLSFPAHLRKYLPNTQAGLHIEGVNRDSEIPRLLRLVVLVSLREIVKGEELFSTYYTIVQKP